MGRHSKNIANLRQFRALERCFGELQLVLGQNRTCSCHRVNFQPGLSRELSGSGKTQGTSMHFVDGFEIACFSPEKKEGNDFTMIQISRVHRCVVL